MLASGLVLAFLVASAGEPVPAFLFGQNLEHTRAAVEGGISAQLVRNRKFAGKPSRDGVAAGWRGYGARPVFDLLHNRGYTRHVASTRMFRQNEISSQFVSSLDAAGEAGVSQDGLALRRGVSHAFKAVVRTPNVEDVTFAVRLATNGRTIAAREFAVRSQNERDWKTIAFDFTPEETVLAELSVGVKGRRCGVIGVVSVLPGDHFHGMRRDVIENLRAIGTSIIRWPGGNFAGEYRWRDGYLADRDERAPLQSYTEIETQTYSYGYDQNDLSPDDILALCEELGAEPFFTINAVWDTPEDSAEWVRRCRGRVRNWSLGNEMGYAHMEGPQGPAAYARMVRPHAEAMLKVDPTLRLTASGKYPGGGQAWIDGAGVPLADIAPRVSYHQYVGAGYYDFTSDERTAAFYDRVAGGADRLLGRLRKFRADLPRSLAISLDEWNLWYPWYRDDGIAEGLFAAKMLHALMREWRALGLEYVCYFQAVNETAIHVGPFGSRLTSVGEAMRLMSGHVGGTPVALPQAPDAVFATDAADGSRYVTGYNFSTAETLSVTVPADGRTQVVTDELLSPNGFSTGCRYRREKLSAQVTEAGLVVTIPPAAMVAVRVR